MYSPVHDNIQLSIVLHNPFISAGCIQFRFFMGDIILKVSTIATFETASNVTNQEEMEIRGICRPLDYAEVVFFNRKILFSANACGRVCKSIVAVACSNAFLARLKINQLITITSSIASHYNVTYKFFLDLPLLPLPLPCPFPVPLPHCVTLSLPTETPTSPCHTISVLFM